MRSAPDCRAAMGASKGYFSAFIGGGAGVVLAITALLGQPMTAFFAAVAGSLFTGLALYGRIGALKRENSKLVAAAAEARAAVQSARDELRQNPQDAADAPQERAMVYDKLVYDRGSNRAQPAFLAHMSHELRTPLNAIVGFADVLDREMRDQPDSAHCLEFIQDIKSSSQYLLSLINNILDMAKIDAGQMELREGAVDLVRLIDGCLRMMRPSAALAGVRLTVERADGCPPFIRADSVRLKQALINLLSNAVAFTPDGGSVTVHVFKNTADEVVIRIDDTGIGMQPEDIPVALTPFRQVTNNPNRSHEGTGLGLPLSLALIEMHGGRLGIASEPGVGTKMSVILPATVCAPAPAPERTAMAHTPSPVA